MMYGGLLSSYDLEEFSLESCQELIKRTYDEFVWLPFVKGSTYDDVLKALDAKVNAIKPDPIGFRQWKQDIGEISRSFCMCYVDNSRDMSPHYFDLSQLSNNKHYLEEPTDVVNSIESDEPDQPSVTN